MGIETLWKDDVFTALNGNEAVFVESGKFTLIVLKQEKLILNLVSIVNDHHPTDLIALQDYYYKKDMPLFHLWEDVWKTKRIQVLSRINSLLHANKVIFARNTSVHLINQTEADQFLNQFHLLGSVKARYKLALIENGNTNGILPKMVAVATFSNKRLMKKTADKHYSIELIRFATREGITVTGGLSKLLKHAIRLFHPSDIMSYADRDWSLGNGYISNGFKLVDTTPPSFLWLDNHTMKRYFPHRLAESLSSEAEPLTDHAMAGKLTRIFNTGNLKYILYCQNG